MFSSRSFMVTCLTGVDSWLVTQTKNMELMLFEHLSCDRPVSSDSLPLFYQRGNSGSEKHCDVYVVT